MGCGSSNALSSTSGDSSIPSSRSQSQTSIDYLDDNKHLYSTCWDSIEPSFPTPTPPTRLKCDLFSIENYTEVDDRARKVPVEYLYGTLEDLVAYLTANVHDDIGRLRALFTWLTSLDLGSLQHTMTRLPEPGSPLEQLLRIHWKMNNYSHLFSTLCRLANVPCEVISGVNKSSAYEMGMELSSQNLEAQWNAVLVQNECHLVDVFWASNCVVGKPSTDWDLVDIDGDVADDTETRSKQDEAQHWVNEFYFMPDPDRFVLTHLPHDARWQLLPADDIVSTEDFESHFYVRERYHELNVTESQNSSRGWLLISKEGEVKIEFGLPSNSSKMQFKYLLYKQKQGEVKDDIEMERFVLYQKTSDILSYTVRFPMTGRYKMEIYGCDVSKHNTLDLMCSYRIDCPEAKVDCHPLPHTPDIGWGPGVEAEEVGLAALTNKDGIIHSEDGKVEIRFTVKNPVSVLQSLRHNDLDEWLLRRHAIIHEESGEMVINMRLPHDGEYALNLFADLEDKEGDLPNVCNYLITCDKRDIKMFPFPDLHGGILGKSFIADKLGVKCEQHERGIIQSNKREVLMTFSHPYDEELYGELHCVTQDRYTAAKHITRRSHQGSTIFNLLLSQTGEYGLNVYCKMKGHQNRIYRVYSYMIYHGHPQGDVIEGQVSKDTLSTPLQDIEVEMPARGQDLLVELKRTNARESPRPDEFRSRREDEEVVFTLHLSQLGEYSLDVMELCDNGALVLIKMYDITRREKTSEEIQAERQAQIEEEEWENEKYLHDEEIQAEEKRRAEERRLQTFRDKLEAAMALKDKDLLQSCINLCQENGLPQPEILRATRLMEYLNLSQALTHAMSARSPELLEAAISRAFKYGLQKKLGLQLAMAERLLDKLQTIVNLKSEILNLNQKTIAEIKSYSKPPEGVHKVMVATFTLLGENPQMLRHWKQVQILIGKTGKQSLKRRVTEFHVDDLRIQVALQAQKIIEKFSLHDVRDLSTGTATFYAWSKAMIDEARCRSS